MRTRFRRLALLIALATAPLSCTGKAKTNSSGPGPNPQATAARIELSDPQATLSTKNVGGRDIAVISWKVKYRFTQGQPEAGAWYLCEGDVAEGATLLEVQGKDLKSEGVFEKPDNAVLKSAPKTIKIYVKRGAGKGMYGDTISNEVTCPVK